MSTADVKFTIKAVIVIAFLVALKYFGERQ